MHSVNARVIREVENVLGKHPARLPRFADYPVLLSEEVKRTLGEQSRIIESFLNKVAFIAKGALLSGDQKLLDLLFSETIAGMDTEFHESLPDTCWDAPVLYRTDQSADGRVYEIQAPGSGWGDVPLLHKVYAQDSLVPSGGDLEFYSAYTAAIKGVTASSFPRVFHMLDAASAPDSIRYLCAETARDLRYWGLSDEVSMFNVDFVISHSAASLVASNAYLRYMQLALSGRRIFSTPPNLLFDQKVIYLLPFYRRTRHIFLDEERAIFPYTALIEDDGFYSISDQFVPLSSWKNWARKNSTRWYLKYGGPSLEKNWGGRAVFRLGGNDTNRLLQRAVEGTRRGEIWILQEDSELLKRHASDFHFISQGIALPEHMKISGFYASGRLIGVKIMLREHFKVHGQADTVISIGI